jgi:hypothetical protein
MRKRGTQRQYSGAAIAVVGPSNDRRKSISLPQQQELSCTGSPP